MGTEDLAKIIQEEIRTTERSVSNLDSICDTTLVGITFLLAGLATWGAFGIGRIIDHDISPVFAWPFLGLIVASGLATTVAVAYIVNSLLPRQFYTAQVGETLLSSAWNPFSTHSTDQSALLDQARETPPDSYIETFLEQYDPGTDVQSYEQFSEHKLRNLKVVAGLKAEATGKGLAWFRISVLCFLGSLVYGGVVLFAMVSL